MQDGSLTCKFCPHCRTRRPSLRQDAAFPVGRDQVFFCEHLPPARTLLLVGYDGERAEFLAQLEVSAAFSGFHQREDKTQPAVKQAEAAEAKPSYPEHRSA